jgi:hypothetical protein
MIFLTLMDAVSPSSGHLCQVYFLLSVVHMHHERVLDPV